MSNFHLLDTVGRGSETQFPVGENLNYYLRHVVFASVAVGVHIFTS